MQGMPNGIALPLSIKSMATNSEERVIEPIIWPAPDELDVAPSGRRRS